MKRPPKFTCLFAASFMTITPYTPQEFLHLAKEQISVSEKISILKRLSDSFPLDSSSKVARENLINLLMNANRYEEALMIYQKDHPETGAGRAVNFKLLEMLLRTGRYGDVLRDTAAASGPVRDFIRDMKLLELRVQALLAKGQFQVARQCVDRWLEDYSKDSVPGGRFEVDVRSIQFLRRHLVALERMNGPVGKSIFTASVPDSLQHWSQQQNVPIVFFKLIPVHPAGQLHEPLLPGQHEGSSYFEDRVSDMNRGFNYISGGQFSLKFSGVHTLYVQEGDLDPESSGGHLLTSRVYIHTIPQLYKLAGDAFVVLVDYRSESDGEAAYMGDGLIHLSASKLQTLVVMHEVLHGLGATHQEWNTFEAQGYKFDPEDRGLMTFERGEIVYLGLEEKNRALLGWPRVAVVRPHFSTDPDFAERLASLGKAVADYEPSSAPSPESASASTETTAPPSTQRPSSGELFPSL
jgi:hypothetical protein